MAFSRYLREYARRYDEERAYRVYMADLFGAFMGARTRFSAIAVGAASEPIDVQATVGKLISGNHLEVKKNEPARPDGQGQR